MLREHHSWLWQNSPKYSPQIATNLELFWIWTPGSWVSYADRRHRLQVKNHMPRCCCLGKNDSVPSASVGNESAWRCSVWFPDCIEWWRIVGQSGQGETLDVFLLLQLAPWLKGGDEGMVIVLVLPCTLSAGSAQIPAPPFPSKPSCKRDRDSPCCREVGSTLS